MGLYDCQTRPFAGWLGPRRDSLQLRFFIKAQIVTGV